MKTLLTLLAAATTFLAAPAADAGQHASRTYVSGRTSCGCPVYTQTYIRGYDRCGHAIYQRRALPVRHHCRPRVTYRSYSTARRAASCRRTGYYTPGFHTGPVVVARPIQPRRCR